MANEAHLMQWDPDTSTWAKMPAYQSFTYSNLNTNSLNAVTDPFDLQYFRNIAIEVKKVSGTLKTAVVTLEKSFDGTSWYPSTSTITGETLLDGIAINTRYARLKVTTVQGLASVATIVIHAKA